MDVENKGRKSTKMLVLCAFFIALITVGAHIKIPTPTVPFTLQFPFVLLAGLILGKKYGTICTALYAFAGLVGLPVFTSGGGFAYVLQPNFGYIIGFVVCGFLCGLISEKKPTYKGYLFAALVGFITVYSVGILYYVLISKFYLAVELEFRTVFLYCFALLAPFDIASCFLTAFVAKRLNTILDK